MKKTLEANVIYDQSINMQNILLANQIKDFEYGMSE